MGITIDVVRVACNTSTGNQTITGSLSGLTPKAALFMMGSATADGTPAAHSHFCYGAATGASNRWAITANDEDAQATSDTHSEAVNDACIIINSPGVATRDGEADFVSFNANNVIINWSNAPASAYLLTVVLFAGSDLSAHANYCSPTTGGLDVTAPGFEPDIVIAAASRLDLVNENSTHHSLTFGVAHWDGVSTVTERNLVGGARNARPTPSAGGAIHNDSTIEISNVNVGTDDRTFTLSSFDSSGFTVTASSTPVEDMFYLALAFGGAVDSYVGSYTTPTATGNDAETGPGFTPQFVMLGMTLLETYNAYNTAGLGGQYGLGVFDAGAEFSTVLSSEDDVADSNTNSLSDNQAVAVMDETGTLDVEATYVSFDANGFTLNYSNITTNAKQFWVLAIEEETVGGVTVAPTAITAVAASVAPTVVLGSVSVAPAARTAVAASVAPTVVLGSVSIAPTAGTAVATSVDPTVVIGDLVITPTAGTAVSTSTGPTVVLGSTTATPAASTAVSTSTGPTVVLGSQTITPSAGTAVATSVDPTVVIGDLVITPTAGTAVSTSTGPTVVLGSLSVTPAASTVVVVSIDPTVDTGGGVSVSPAAISAVAANAGPTVVLGSISVTPAASTAVAATPAPTVIAGSLSLSPTFITAVAATIDPTVIRGSLAITPAASTVVARARPQFGGAVVLGSTTATPSPVTAVATSVAGTVIEGTQVRYDVTIEDSVVWSATIQDSEIWSTSLVDSAIWSVALQDEQYDDAV